jgi:hypothetical protein
VTVASGRVRGVREGPAVSGGRVEGLGCEHDRDATGGGSACQGGLPGSEVDSALRIGTAFERLRTERLPGHDETEQEQPQAPRPDAVCQSSRGRLPISYQRRIAWATRCTRMSDEVASTSWRTSRIRNFEASSIG